MSDRKRNILDTAVRIDYYGEANPQLASEVPYTVELFANNKNNITRLNQAGITSVSSSGAGASGTRSKVARFNEIVADLRLAAKTGRRAEKKFSNFQNTFTLPRDGGLTYDEALERADSFIADAPASKDILEKYALNTNFWTNLGTKIAEFREAWQQQADGKRASVGATADAEAVLEDTLDNFKELDRVLKNHYRDNPQKLAEWLTASHIERKKSSATNTTNGNPPTT